MEARKTGGSWLAVFCTAMFLLTAFAAGAWAGDAASFVSKTYPDNSTIAGGTSFTQRWTIRNSGTTTWTSSYKLRWMSGSLSYSHTDIPISGTVTPGNTYSFSMAMRTPAAQSSAATYKEEWKFINGSGSTLAPLGSLWAQIVVPAYSDDHGNSISTATAVSSNTSRTGTINYAGDYDYFRIVVPSNGTLTVYTTGSTDTYGYLKNSSGSDIASNDDYSDINFRISRIVTAGTYYVAVRHYSSTGTGSYTFYNTFAATPSDDHGNSTSTATAVSVNTSKSGTINYAGDYDYFRVSVPSSGTLTVYTTGSTDTYGYLKNSSGSDLASNDDYNGSVNFRISQSVSAGTYYVAVRHYSSTGSGYYTLSVIFTATSTNPLNVPYLKQQSIPVIGNSACASASAAMILAYHKKIGSTQQDMINAAQDVWNNTGSSTSCGLCGNLTTRFIPYLQAKGFSSVSYDKSLWEPLYERVKTEIKNGRPMILRSTSSLTSAGHYIVVIGYEGEDYRTGKVIVNDPYGRWNGSVNNYSTSISGAGLKYSFTAITSAYEDGVVVIRP